MCLSPVQEFYENKSVFITGATGFVGKVLLEKLLRTCGSLDKIYILLRPKRNVGVEERLNDLLESSLFETLKETHPEFHKKIISINGDVTLPGLGISEADRFTLQKNVHIVFHSAATIKFDEPLDVAMQVNFHGARKLLELCKEIQNLNAFIHISTAYTNAENDFIEEKIYSFMSTTQIEHLLMAIEGMDKHKLHTFQKVTLGQKANTYLFTKSVVENYLEQNQGSLPLAIIRPSIVTATVEEPVPGWVDNAATLSGILLFTGTGNMRFFHVSKRTKFDFVPVDYVVNYTILAAWKTAIHKIEKTDNPESSNRHRSNLQVYNCCSQNPISFKNLAIQSLTEMYKNPFEKIVFRPRGFIVYSPVLYKIADTIFHWLPARIIDFVMTSDKNSLSLTRVYKKGQAAVGVLHNFMMNSWTFERNNIHALHRDLAPRDRTLFPLFVKDLNYPVYFKNHIAGTKKYLLKETGNALPSQNNTRKEILSRPGRWLQLVRKLKLK